VARDHERVSGPERVDVHEGEEPLVLVDDAGGGTPGGDVAEVAVRHGWPTVYPPGDSSVGGPGSSGSQPNAARTSRALTRRSCHDGRCSSSLSKQIASAAGIASMAASSSDSVCARRPTNSVGSTPRSARTAQSRSL